MGTMIKSLLLTLPLISVSASAITANATFGPFRPNLYFGMRAQTPQSLMTGLIWYGAQDFQSISRARHACEQGDQLGGYTWEYLHYDEQDGEAGGSQVILDTTNNLRLRTSFFRSPSGAWGARIEGEPIAQGKGFRPALIWYQGIEGLGMLEMDSDELDTGLPSDEPLLFSGESPELGEFTLKIIEDENNVRLTPGPQAGIYKDTIGKTSFLGVVVQGGNLWQAKEVILQRLLRTAQEGLEPYGKEGPFPDPAAILRLPNEVYTGSNLFAVQKVFDGPFSFDIFYGKKRGMTSAEFTAGLARVQERYESGFKDVFPITSEYADDEEVWKFSRAITANLIGGIGYFHGSSIIDRSFNFEWDEDDFSTASDPSGPELTSPMTLLTATPSRSFFPRGFYWDEGFHLLHLLPLQPRLALDILQSWMDLVDDDGWVAREQILGEEARSKVPQEFQVQVPRWGNPPTLVVAVAAYIRQLRDEKRILDLEMDMDFGMGEEQMPLGTDMSETLTRLRALYIPLKRHYEWFRRTQRGLIKPYSPSRSVSCKGPPDVVTGNRELLQGSSCRSESYRWRGRNTQHVLTSGMDDYPRTPVPSVGELHLDLMCWMGLFSRTMGEIAGWVATAGIAKSDFLDDKASYDSIYASILSNLDDLHWSEEEHMYCDATVDEEDEHTLVCHRGYLSLFPLLLELLPVDSPKLPHLLDLMRDPEHLWSNYGLRSLSKSEPEFGQGENYWKGPVWVQMNYLALGALSRTYASLPGPYQVRAKHIYDELRTNVIQNVFKEYQRTGYVWEQYDALTGEGRRSHPFTGWTSLVTLILAEKY